MFSPRWRKVFRDLWGNKARSGLVIAALALGSLGLTTVSTAFSILERDLPRNYLGTTPASFIIHTDAVDEALLRAVRARPGVALAEAGHTVLAQVRVGRGWKPLNLFVSPDLRRTQIATFRLVAGDWPAGPSEILLERSSMSVLGARVGDHLTVRVPGGPERTLIVSGAVHNPGLSPGWMDGLGNGFLMPASLAQLGGSGLDEIKVVVSETPYDRAHLQHVGADLAVWLERGGHPVSELQIPPPGRHPHQGQMDALVLVLALFSLFTLGLGGVLLASTLAALLAKQTRQIGVMKAVGGRTSQIVPIYLGTVLMLALTGLAIGWPFGLWAGRVGAAYMAGLLNLELSDEGVPLFAVSLQAGAGLLLPLALALYPVLRGARVTVLEAFGSYGVNPQGYGSDGFDGWLARLRFLSRPLAMSLRNTFRQRERLWLTVGVLVAGGTLFISALNVSRAWNQMSERSYAARPYDIEARLAQSVPTVLAQTLETIPGVRAVEAWGYAPSAVVEPNGLQVTGVYPDNAHGSFVLLAPPPNTRMANPQVQRGRWLEPDDVGAVVFNETALNENNGLHLGDAVTLRAFGRDTHWRLVGVIRETAAPAAAYVALPAFARAVGQPGAAQTFRVATERRDAALQASVARAVEDALERRGVASSYVLTLSDTRAALDNHIVILTGTLLAMAALTALVGGLGLASALGINVLERTAEFGVMRAVGGRGSQILGIVLGEGLLIGALSWLGAAILALPLSNTLGIVMGQIGFGMSLELTPDIPGALLWLGLVMLISVISSLVPAYSAARLTVQQALSYR